jgi:membrane protein DedA with SNARE-associated domain
MEFLQSHLDFLARHLYALVFGAFLIEAAGIPFPSRVILIVAATLTVGIDELAGLIALSALGAVIGDHVPYTAGRLVGPRLLTLYCRVTPGSNNASRRRWRTSSASAPPRSSQSILRERPDLRLRALGCGHISYVRFLRWDVVGSVIYATVWASLGYLVGDHAQELLKRFGGARVLLLIGPAAFVTLLAYRLWRRSRYGAAQRVEITALTCESPRATDGLRVPR